MQRPGFGPGSLCLFVFSGVGVFVVGLAGGGLKMGGWN